MWKEGEFSTAYQSLEVWKSEDEAEFRVAGAVHAWHHRACLLTGLAWDLIAAAPLLMRGTKPRSILMLGFAGGTAFRILRHLLPDCRLVAVDIDAELIELAREHMRIDDIGAEIIIDDAYGWLRQNRRKFDVVIDDIYLAGIDDVFRPRELDVETIRLLATALKPDGLLAMNLVTGAGHRILQTKARSVLRAEFPVVRALKTPDAQNEVLVAGRDVSPSGLLRLYQEMFGCPADREFWSRISDQKL